MFENVSDNRQWFMDHVDERVHPRNQGVVAARAFDAIRHADGVSDDHLMAAGLLLGQYTEVTYGKEQQGSPVAPDRFPGVGLDLAPHEIDQVIESVNTTVNQVTTTEDLTTLERPTRYVGSVDYDETDMAGTYLRRVRESSPLLEKHEWKEQNFALGQLIQQGRSAQAEKDLLLAEGATEEMAAGLDRQIAEGKAAHAEMVVANLPFAIHIAKLYTGKGVAFDDLIQEANLTLTDAVEKWLPEEGSAFTSYAGVALRRKLQTLISERSGLIRIPGHVTTGMREYRGAVRRLSEKHGTPPTNQQIQDEADLSYKGLENVKSGFAADKPMLPLEPHIMEPTPEEYVGEDHGVWPRTIRNADETTYSHVEETVDAERLRAEIESALETLSEREAGVIRLRFGLTDGEPKTYDEIAKVYGVTRERIRQLESKTMSKLRNPQRSDFLRDFLDSAG